MIKYVEQIDNYVIDVEAWKNCRIDYGNFASNKNVTQFKEKYFESLNLFFEWYLQYSDEILKQKKYDEKQISQHIFRTELKTEKQEKEFLKTSIYVSKQYVENLKSKITLNNIQNYDHCITDLQIDLEWLIANIEISLKKTVKKLKLNSSSYKFLRPTDIYMAAKTLFFIEECQSIEQLYLRDLKPNIMFQIRQLLEIFGKNLIGYYAITDKAGVGVKKFSQIAWDFIKEEVKNKPSRIDFPFDVHTIIAINKWSNSFVHTTYLHSSYIQFFALNAVGIIFKSSGKDIITYTGKKNKKFGYADIKISNYNSLKLDFEDFLVKKKPDISVHWLDKEDVGAYIVSE